MQLTATNFIFPTVQRVTSGFRPPDRPDHHGVDFAEAGYHEIKASATGTVSRSYYSDSYGEVIFIVHNIQGQIYETVYAHLQENSRRVIEGATVVQGAGIGVMGNTGDSHGQHLHFEMHLGRWNDAKSNAINPLPLLGEWEDDGGGDWTPPGDWYEREWIGAINRHNTNMRRMGVRGRR